MDEERHLLNKICKILEDKKAQDLKVMDVNTKTIIADYFIISSGTSNTHIKSLAQEVVNGLKKENILPYSREGMQTASWILLDYGKIIVHIFSPQMRQFYDIEHLWGTIEA